MTAEDLPSAAQVAFMASLVMPARPRDTPAPPDFRRDGTETSVREYAERKGVAPGTMKRWVHEGLPVHRHYGHVLVRPAEADAWIAENRARSVAFDRVAQVYFVRRERDGAIKIGWSSDVDRRLVELGKGGERVRLLAVVYGDKAMEQEAHRLFAEDRIEGEWFRDSLALQAYIDGLNTSQSPRTKRRRWR